MAAISQFRPRSFEQNSKYDTKCKTHVLVDASHYNRFTEHVQVRLPCYTNNVRESWAESHNISNMDSVFSSSDTTAIQKTASCALRCIFTSMPTAAWLVQLFSLFWGKPAAAMAGLPPAEAIVVQVVSHHITAMVLYGIENPVWMAKETWSNNNIEMWRVCLKLGVLLGESIPSQGPCSDGVSST